MNTQIPAKGLRPRQRAIWNGYQVECERQARRTTFLRLLDPELEGARVQIKRNVILERTPQ